MTRSDYQACLLAAKDMANIESGSEMLRMLS